MDFKILINMVQTISRNRIKHIEVLGNSEENDSLIESLYNGIAKGNITSDEAAVKYIYGHTDKKDAAYQRLKSRLIRQLTNTAHFMDVNQPAFNERTKAFYNCYHDFASAFALTLRGAVKPGIYMLEQILEHSIKYEFIELSADIARYLRASTARGTNGQKPHQYYVDLHREYEEKRRLEMLALDYYEELVDYYMTRRSPNEEVKQRAEQYHNKLLLMAEKADTSRFYYYIYQVAVIKHFANNDCKSVIQLVDEALLILQSRKNTNRSMLSALSLQKLACLTQLRIFDDNLGEEIIQYCLSLIIEKSNMEIEAYQTYCYYLTYKRKYSEALNIFEKSVTHVQFAYLEGSFRDNWLLIGGYLHLLAALGKLNPVEVERIAGPYRYGRLVNEIQVVDKDREGMNIPLILLPALFNVAQGNYQDYGRSKEALEKYRQRYLDNEVNQRSAVFVNMLMALDKKAFNPVDAEKRIAKGLKALSQENPQVIGQSFAIEIIPYEDLWEMLSTKMAEKG